VAPANPSPNFIHTMVKDSNIKLMMPHYNNICKTHKTLITCLSSMPRSLLNSDAIGPFNGTMPVFVPRMLERMALSNRP